MTCFSQPWTPTAARRWEQISRFRVAASITGAIWALKGKPGLLGDVVLEGETRDQRLKITPFPQRLAYAVDILGGGPPCTTRRSTASSTGS